MPGVDVGLGAVGKRAAALGEPAKQRGGLNDLLTDVAVAGRDECLPPVEASLTRRRVPSAFGSDRRLTSAIVMPAVVFGLETTGGPYGVGRNPKTP